MRFPLITLLISAIAFGCSNDKIKDTEMYVPKGSMVFFDTLSNKYEISSKDTSLIISWDSFARAALIGDFITLKSMSADCISCMNCMKLDEEYRDMGVEEFYRDHASFIFDSLFVSLMNNNKYVRGSYKTDDWYPDSTCITTNTRIDNPKGVNVYVSFPLRKGDYEGSTAILDFIETKLGYKFYGYSTIP
jgi:hypothetical protein